MAPTEDNPDPERPRVVPGRGTRDRIPFDTRKGLKVILVVIALAVVAAVIGQLIQ